MVHFFNVRGTNGSGKTRLISCFAKGKPRLIHDGYVDAKGRKCRLWAHYDDEQGVAVLGKYADGTCGGTDGIKSQEAVRAAAVLAAGLPGCRAVMFEGLLVSGLFQSYVDFDRSLQAQGHRYTWAFMRTPYDTCYERVLQRSKRNYVVPHDNIIAKYRAVESVRSKVLKLEDLTVLDLEDGWDAAAGEPAAAAVVRAHVGIR